MEVQSLPASFLYFLPYLSPSLPPFCTRILCFQQTHKSTQRTVPFSKWPLSKQTREFVFLQTFTGKGMPSRLSEADQNKYSTLRKMCVQPNETSVATNPLLISALRASARLGVNIN